MAECKFTSAHKEVLYQQVAAYNDSPTKLEPWLADAENAERFGFEPVEIGRSRICQIISKLDQEKIAKLRALYLADFNDLPLSHKKERVSELSKMYWSSTDDVLCKTVFVRNGKEVTAEVVECSDVEILNTRKAILAQIQSEMGETLDKMNRDNGITINLAIVEKERTEKLRTGLERFGFSLNGQGS